MIKEKVVDLLTAVNVDSKIKNDLAEYLIKLKGESFEEFESDVGEFFWDISNDHNLFENEDSAEDYYRNNLDAYLKTGQLRWITDYWGGALSHVELSDLSYAKKACYLLDYLEHLKIKKIYQDLFDIING